MTKQDWQARAEQAEADLKTTRATIRVMDQTKAAMQAKIDALMLEYCPDEMTPEQLATWEASQRLAFVPEIAVFRNDGKEPDWKAYESKGDE